MTPTLVDTSVWIDHLRSGNTRLSEMLGEGTARCHQFVIGELACGNLRERATTLALLAAIPSAEPATHEDAMLLVDSFHLSGKGLGWIDVNLLAAARLSDINLWTLDRRLAVAADQFGVSPARA